MADAPKKKVVRVEPSETTKTSKAGGRPVWKPTEEAKKKATNLRIVAWVAWVLAIGAELFAIFYLMRQDPIQMTWLIVTLVVIAALAIGGNLAWRQANRLDPASKKNKTKFFIQNQLGGIMTVIAFLPLALVVFTDKNMDNKEKAWVGGLGIAAMVLIAATTGISWDGGPSVEQYTEEEDIITLLTGEDVVYWTKNGSVFHVCADVPDVNKESKDGQIYEGTVADAHASGKDRLTKRWASEAVNHCGYTREEVDEVKRILEEKTPAEVQEEENIEEQEDLDEDDAFLEAPEEVEEEEAVVEKDEG